MSPALRRLLPCLAACALAGAPLGAQSPDHPAPKQTPSIGALFAPPTAWEVQAVRAEWAARQPVAASWRYEAAGMVGGHDLRVVSHVVDGHRHYGLIRLPSKFTPGGSHPVLVYLHGGANGIKLAKLDAFDRDLMPGHRMPEEFVYVVPSFRAEPLDAGPLGVFVSEGEPSPLDRDVDDAMALLSVALEAVPEADRLRIGAFGSSRGGGTALLMGARDERVRFLVNVSGIADLTLPMIAKDVWEIVTTRRPADSPVLRMVMQRVVEPYLAGSVDLGEARRRLLRSSPAWFAADLPELQVHHGRLDDVVQIQHANQLDDQLALHGARWTYWSYLYGEHGLPTLPGAGRWVESRLVEMGDGPASFCGMDQGTARGGARIAYEGSAHLAADDLTLSVSDAPPAAVGAFLYGPTESRLPLGQGVLCVGNPIARLPGVTVDAAGTASTDVDVAAGPFTPGSTWHFQFLYRDAAGQDLSDALRVTFRP